ncbi:hypothetical protein BH09BAC1_BH09BAC1_13500 [soil metagenome]
MKAIYFSLMVLFALGCKTNKEAAKETMPMSVVSQPAPLQAMDDGAKTQGISVNIDGTLWNAESYSLVKMGTFWVIKGLGKDKAVFSIMLPDPLITMQYTVSQGGAVSITYSKAPEKGLTYLAPYSDNNGWVKTSVNDGYLQGTLDVTLNSGGETKHCIGMFALPINSK